MTTARQYGPSSSASCGRTRFVAEIGRAVLGFLSVRHAATAELELTAIYVWPDQNGHGVGSRLYQQFEAERRPAESGEVWASNQRAASFYLRRGWAATSTVRPGC